ncbi:hypothetical protein DL546_001747 [Coniochaeta pulveracea]|uniref:AB hydrolase-1 domain-containing protein n=1 Tax=Coniochaeta pulveracea TaxID=177199 RepID=A0A420XXC4_9PEZI|nr:hypothetical protein DL546_001747 [Coniochaeta pulveracea]
MADKLTPTDSRVTHNTTAINSKTYHYLLAQPSSSPKATILLLHGWPDLSFGWRYQIPYLVNHLHLRVIVPDLPGYGRTAAPQSLSAYSAKSVSTDCIALVDEVLGPKTEKEPIFVGGHDWGGFLAWRVALWFPERVKAVFSVCTPYAPPAKEYRSLEEVVKVLPNFTYQLQLAGPEVEARIDGGGEKALRGFVNGMYGGRTEGGEVLFNPQKGLNLDLLEEFTSAPLVSKEEADFYVQEYSRNGMRGPLNWYRTRKVNYEEEMELFKLGRGEGKISMPALFITAKKDAALPPAMSKGMDGYFETLVRREVDANHWALWEASQDVNKYIGEFISDVLEGRKLQASL